MIVLSNETLHSLLEYMTAVREEVREVLERTPASAHESIGGHVLAAEQITEVLDKLSGINEFFIAAILDSVFI
jgi:hypothetical protein